MEPETTPTIATPRERRQFDSAYQVLADAIAARAFPGCAFGVIVDREVVLQDALGRFTYDEDASPVTAKTIFDVASLTKVVATTAAVMLLYQRGQIDLNLPLGELLPAFVIGRGPGELAHKVRLRHLLAHNSGLPGYVEFFRSITTPAGLLRACLELKLEGEPGARAEYSDPGFILLGKALEVLIQESLADWVAKQIFEPLALSSTFFCPARQLEPLIPPTEEDIKFRHRRIQGEVQDENACVLNGAAGHAGLFSNVPDLLRFSGAILAALDPEARPGMSPLFEGSTIEHFAERQEPRGSSRALGWDTPSPNSSAGTYFSPHSIGHLGYSGCSLWIDLEVRVAVVLLTNRTWPDRQSQLIRQVRPAFHNAVRESISSYK
jgi:CubicO group peptidase (beta-lactamase class C family)